MSDPVANTVVPLPPLTLEQFRASINYAMSWVVWAVQLTPTGLGIRTIVAGLQAVIADDDAARFLLQRVNDFRAKGLTVAGAVASIVAYVREEFDYNPTPKP